MIVLITKFKCFLVKDILSSKNLPYLVEIIICSKTILSISQPYPYYYYANRTIIQDKLSFYYFKLCYS
ncbi:hypothetical protein BpHYR1_006947 [Brachionus plicatilis]|uniref:Uncharacterized protein n=1 Tax=Brachionus plicatilis TaxID=10195 RepID=A0A3M7QHZ1_BRAPC|nr:hypothetical protein BpHYR1_006947 [Brachionus plicatilis]